MLKQGSSGADVRKLQTKLNKILDAALIVDGHFGETTLRAVRQYQSSISELEVDGIVGPKTMASIDRLYAQYSDQFQMLGKGEFVVFVDAGHGGLDASGRYVTLGKRAYHEGADLHNNGHYYEGVENRIVAERFIAELTALGLQCVRTYHPWKDTPLRARAELVRSYLQQGYGGYTHSFHSNAISSRNTRAKLESTKGFMVFTTAGNTFSDDIAEQHFKNVKKETPGWHHRTQLVDGDSDYEVNFQILRETDLEEFSKHGAILEEWGFHTSREDAEFIIQSRDQRVRSAVKTALWVKKELKNAT